MCDCGDSEAWESKGNCKYHTGFVEEDEIVPKSIKEKLVSMLKKTFYFIFQAVEIFPKKKLRKNATNLIKEVLDILIELSSLYPTMTPVVSRAFSEDLNYSNKRKIMMYHDSDKLDGAYILMQTPIETSTSILKLLLRYNQRLSENMCVLITKFFMSLFVDYKFKKVISVEFLNHFNYYFDLTSFRPKMFPEHSNIIDIAVQLLTSEELGLLVIQNSKIHYILESMNNLLKKFIQTKSNQIMIDSDFFIYRYMHLLEYCLMKRQGIVYFFSNIELVKMYFGLADTVQEGRVKYVKVPDSSKLTEIEEITENQSHISDHLVSNIIDICGVFITLPDPQKKPLIVNSLIVLKDYILHRESQQAENKPEAIPKHRTFIYPLERSFSCLLITYCYFELNSSKTVQMTEFNVQKYMEIMDLVFSDKEERDTFWRIMAKNISKVTGFMREISRQCWVN